MEDIFMNTKIKLFGQLSDIAGTDHIVLENISDTNSLQEQLKKYYPLIATSVYVIAVGEQIVQENTGLKENQYVALLPPFSGG
jgi:molybdopterin converting factor small subunit